MGLIFEKNAVVQKLQARMIPATTHFHSRIMITDHYADMTEL